MLAAGNTQGYEFSENNPYQGLKMTMITSVSGWPAGKRSILARAWTEMGVLLLRSSLRSAWHRLKNGHRGRMSFRHRIADAEITFNVDNPTDAIQRHHVMGVFYEQDELNLIAAYCPVGAVYVDIGANIGNHLLFVAAFLQPERLIPFEPNPQAISLLVANIEANGLAPITEMSHLGVGLSDHDEEGYDVAFVPINLGGARMRKGGDIAVRKGDPLLADVQPDFIKIDVEGMEMGVLAGLEQTLVRARPVLLVEVHDANHDAFRHWLAGSGYRVEREMRHDLYRNFLLLPQEGARDA